MSPCYFHVKEHTLPCQYIREYPGAILDSQEDTLLLHIKQYTPSDQSQRQHGAVTIIGAHANGIPKEIYEPLWDELYQAFKARGQAIRGIWIADVAQQGTSGVLNEDKLGNDPSWADHPRDLLHMINHFRKEMPRPLIGIGHSMGATQLVNLAYIHPRLLSCLVLIDPVIQNSYSLSQGDGYYIARASTFRRDRWSSRAEAAAWFKKQSFFKSWDPRVLDLWIEHGVRELPTAVYPQSLEDPDGSKVDGAPVTLTTTKHQEVFTFLRPNFDGLDANARQIINRRTHPDLDLTVENSHPFYTAVPPIAFKNLPHLRPGALYIFGGQSELSPPNWRKERMECTGIGVGGSGGLPAGKVSEVLFEDLGHLIPMVAVERCALAAAQWLMSELERWRREEQEWKREWNAKDGRERFTISEEWKNRIGGDPRRKNEKL